MPTETAGKRFARSTAKKTPDLRTLLQRLRDLEAQVALSVEPERKKEIGARLKRARENSPYHQSDLAAAAGVGVRAYQFWEQGRSIERTGIARVAKKLGVPFSDIWVGSELDQDDRLDALAAEIHAHHERVEEVMKARTVELVSIRDRLHTIETDQAWLMQAATAIRELLLRTLPPTEAKEAQQIQWPGDPGNEQRRRDSGT